MAVEVGAMYAATYSTFLFIVVMVVALVFNRGGALSVAEGFATSGVRMALSYIPYALLAWGFIVSFLTLEYRYMIAPLYGILAIAICIASEFVFGKFLPMFVASSSAILTYYTYDYLVQNINGNVVKNILASLFSFGILLAQLLSTRPAATGTYLFTASLLNDGLASILGLSVGLGGWFTIHSTSPDLLPFTGKPPMPRKPQLSEKERNDINNQIKDVEKDIEYLQGLGLKAETNDTLKNRLQTRETLVEKLR